jgi:peptidoglycan/xylan/chitin deacetylase (PgdA/CDA1 family)
MLAVLKPFNISAVFFSEGKLLEKRPELGLITIQEGHILGNHAFSHPHFSDLPLDACCREIQQTDEIIHSLYDQAGQPQHPRYFRFPYGDKGDGRYGRVLNRWKIRNRQRHRYLQDFLKEMGYTQPSFANITHPFYHRAGLLRDVDWHWTFDVMEWAVHQPMPALGLGTEEKVIRRLKSLRPADCRGSLRFHTRWLGDPYSAEIILMHDQEASRDSFPVLLKVLRELPLNFSPILA